MDATRNVERESENGWVREIGLLAIVMTMSLASQNLVWTFALPT